MNLLLGTMEELHLINITKDDMLRWRGPGYNRQILLGTEGHDRISERVSGNEPLLVARLGAVELGCIRHYLEKRGLGNTGYGRKISTAMANNAGFFPASNESLDTFAKFFLEHLAQVDVMGVWFNPYENVICNDYCPDAELVDFDCLEPFRFANPWSSRLAGRKVLVIHPFVESIRKQYEEKRRLLFPSPDVLPAFDLKTLKSVQSIGGSKVRYDTWFDAYDFMCEEMEKIDFDICIIGAGAYGLPLAAHAKKLGKQAIHLGGVTQILFGIKGKRWERDPAYATTTAKLFNEHWVRPLDSETPVHKNRIEKGCYW